MGFGFSIPNNPYDRVAVRLGKVQPETHRILRESMPTRWQSATWNDEESVFYVGGKSQAAFDVSSRHGVQRLSCLRGIPLELTKSVYIIMFQHGRTHVLDNQILQKKDNWVATIEVLLHQMKSSLLGITQWDGELPESPSTNGAKAAMAYRTGQVKILEEVASGLKAFLYSLQVGDVGLQEVGFGTDEIGIDSFSER